MSRTYSSPGFESSIDPPMRLAEIYVAAEHALKKTISSSDLWNCLSAVEEFEVKNMQQYLLNTTTLVCTLCTMLSTCIRLLNFQIMGCNLQGIASSEICN